PGRRWRTVTSAGGRPPPFWMQNGLPRRCSPTRRGPACWTRPPTCPTAGSPSRLPRPARPAGTGAAGGRPRGPPRARVAGRGRGGRGWGFSFLCRGRGAGLVGGVRPGSGAELARLCAAHGVPATALGTVGGGGLEVAGSFAVPLDELAAVHRGTLPALFG